VTEEDSFRLPLSYREIAEDIRQKIDSGLYPYGSRLPSTAELVREYGVSEATVERAVRLLVASGDVVGRQGLGRYVTRR
jgi:DNA-binding GntR family transcriptional regulator